MHTHAHAHTHDQSVDVMHTHTHTHLLQYATHMGLMYIHTHTHTHTNPRNKQESIPSRQCVTPPLHLAARRYVQETQTVWILLSIIKCVFFLTKTTVQKQRSLTPRRGNRTRDDLTSADNPIRLATLPLLAFPWATRPPIKHNTTNNTQDSGAHASECKN